jgi:mannose-1-phosphate guanylyltransferase
VFEPSVIDRIPDGRKVSIERETFPLLVADGTLYALQADDYWVDAGTPDTYLQVQLDLVDGTRGHEAPIAPTATVDPTAVVEHSVVMAGATIGAGAIVRDAAVLPGATVGAGASVLGSIVGPNAVVGDGATVTGLTILGDGATVEPGASLDGARVPQP